jgi:hypothetical protein
MSGTDYASDVCRMSNEKFCKSCCRLSVRAAGRRWIGGGF